ncbi:hypothetical protein A9Q84_12575 [Halobacteriovorax marinus]|uniref:Kazal-like domain-containing protein n=1 Tax=Halobacteriovorax marinus TaxID=97084 RepID=A0A1Y5F8S1_9BACT|nr:hypothetical protein A9Q84_12575 [Halobacteriovorax marinus]
MKTLTTLLLLLISLSATANVAFTVSGKLVPNLGENSDLVHMVLKTSAGDFPIVSFDHKVQTCENGLYEIVNNWAPADTYSLLEVYACLDTEEDEPAYCPEIYMPICGQPKMPKCESDVCIQVMPETKTYGNFCELLSSGANFVYNGECENE